MNITIAQIVEIEKYLKVLLSVKGTGFSYQTTKNILKLESIKKHYNNAVTKLEEQYHIKNENGTKIKYLIVYDQANGLGIYQKNSEGKFIEAKDNESSAYMVEQTQEYRDCMQKFNEELHEIEFHEIPENEIEELMKKGGPLDGVNISGLFGTVIISKS